MISAAKARANPGPQAYSYLRFSTPEQALGASELRQIEAARAWAKRKGIPLNESIKPDRGLSGYHGAHRKKGALGEFLRMVEAGEIVRGSILIVENIDRLSREGVSTTLRQIIFKLWDHGITLQTLSPEETYEPGCDSSPKFLALFMYMQRAQDESLRKSERISDARERARNAARENGKTLTKNLPDWLVATNDGNRELIPERGEAVCMIFELASEGVSVRGIEARMNAKAPWIPMPHGWRTSYVKKILNNRAVLGEYQPHKLTDGKRQPTGDPILGYFPAVVPPDLFHAVQQRLAGNRTTGGRTGVAGNVLTHLVKCAYCRGPMRYVDKGKPPKGAKYFVCDNAVRGMRDERGKPVCTRHHVRYDECVELLIYNCRRLRPGDVLPKADDQDKLVRGLKTGLQGALARLTEVETQLANLTERVGDAPSKESSDRIFKLIDAKEQDKAALVAQRDTTEAELRKAETSTRSFVQWRDDLEALKDAIDTGGPETRLRLRSHLRDFIERIEVFAIGCEDPERERNKSAWRGSVPLVARTKGFERKLRELNEAGKYMSGRFYRVHFKCDTVVDLIPERM